jgi:hypothetical protein
MGKVNEKKKIHKESSSVCGAWPNAHSRAEQRYLGPDRCSLTGLQRSQVRFEGVEGEEDREFRHLF